MPVSGSRFRLIKTGIPAGDSGARSPRYNLPLDMYKSYVTMQLKLDWVKSPAD